MRYSPEVNYLISKTSFIQDREKVHLVRSCIESFVYPLLTTRLFFMEPINWSKRGASSTRLSCVKLGRTLKGRWLGILSFRLKSTSEKNKFCYSKETSICLIENLALFPCAFI